MNPIHTRLFYLAPLALLVATAAIEATDPPRPRIPTINDGDVPIGHLGFPMGTYLTIEGVVVHRVALRSETYVKVDTVNGRRLPEPRGIWVEGLYGMSDGTRCVVKGYENGFMCGLPPGRIQADKEAGKQTIQVQQVWGFMWNFVATSIDSPQGVPLGGQRSWPPAGSLPPAKQ